MTTETTEVKTVEQKKEIQVENGNYVLNTVQDQLAFANYLMNQGLVSDTFKKPSQLVLAIQACKDLGLPNSCLKDFYVIGGRPAIYGDTFLALMHGSGLVEEFIVSFFDETGETIGLPKKGQVYFGCAIEVKRKGAKKESLITYTMDDKELSRNNNPTWNKSQRDMLFRRAAGRVAKWIFADAIRGIEMGDYLAIPRSNPISKLKPKSITKCYKTCYTK